METINDKDWVKLQELRNEYYLLHSRLINDLLKRCDNDWQREHLLVMISEENSPYSRDEKA